MIDQKETYALLQILYLSLEVLDALFLLLDR